MDKKVVFFTNIIAPYRVSLFNNLENLRKETGFDFEVYFMRLTESNRNWEINLNDLKFKYEIGHGIYFSIHKYYFHFNPILIFKAIRSKNEIILGAAWNNINVLSIALLKSLGLINNTLSVWSEANYLTISSQKQNKFRDNLRRWFFSKIDGHFVIPGKMAQQSFQKWSIPIKNTILLPNLVSNELFGKIVKYENKLNEEPIFLIIARLEENIKGVLNFIKSIGIDNLMGIQLRIAGTGSSFDEYVAYIKKNKLDNHIHLLGNLTQKEISVEYQKANIFVLPSFSDPSPLTLIESTTSGLPLLVSERCGNHYEALVEGENGYTFDPYDSVDIKSKFEKLMSQRDQWAKFSENSILIAKHNFDNNKVLKELITCYLSE